MIRFATLPAMKASKQTIWLSLKVTGFIFCALWWGGLNCLASCVADEWARAAETCEHHCCAMKRAAAQHTATPGFNVSSTPALDCCALADLTALETSQPKHSAPLLITIVPNFAAFLPLQTNFKSSFSLLAVPDKSTTRLRNCVWRI